MSELPDLFYASLEEINNGLASDAFSSVDLTLAYVARIREVNPRLNAVLEINAYATLEAARLDRERKNGQVRSILHGIPILLKDNMATARTGQADLNTTSGNHVLTGSIPSGDSTVVKRLKAAGAIILGKTNMSVDFRSSEGSNGWSGRGGQAFGAYSDKQGPGASSSGSAVAASIGLCTAALGTETIASLNAPARINHITTIKPTAGLTSRHLVMPISLKQDTVGPLAGDIKTCAAILSIIAGKDDNDDLTSAIPFDKTPDYLSWCRIDGLKDAVLGIPTNFINSAASEITREEKEAFEAVLPLLKQLGAEVHADANFPALAEYEAADFTMLLEVDFAQGTTEYLSKLKHNPAGIESITDLIEKTEACPGERTATYDTATWRSAVKRNMSTSSPDYIELAKKRAYLGGEGTIQHALDTYKLDALVVPSTESVCAIAALNGYPMISIPLARYADHATGKTDPKSGAIEFGPNAGIGLAFIGPKWSEERLIGYAYAVEQATQFRKTVQPMIKPSTQLADVMTTRS